MERIVSVPYEDYQALTKDSADKAAIVLLLNTKFPDDTCQLIAIKALLGIIEEESSNNEPSGGGDPSTDPTDPPTDPTP